MGAHCADESCMKNCISCVLSTTTKSIKGLRHFVQSEKKSISKDNLNRPTSCHHEPAWFTTVEFIFCVSN